MQLRGKTVLITGAARRIGRQIAKTLAQRGASLVLHYNHSRKEAQGLQAELEKDGSEVHLVAADFSKSLSSPRRRGSRSLDSRFRGNDIAGTVETFVKNVYREVPRVDVLINNASIFYPTPFGKITEKDWDDFLTVNLKAPFFLSQAFGMRMLKQKSGKIINLVDWTGDRPSLNYLPYSISKAGLIAATKGLAKILAPHVQVAGVAPGPIMPAESASKKEQAKAAQRSLLKRYGRPEDVAETVRFLIEGTDFITGSVISVEGGAALA
jgi:pteridine reductase